MTAEYVGIEPLDEGYVVRVSEDGVAHPRRIAATSRLDALTLAARALGYRGVIRFDDEPRTVEVPVVALHTIGVPFDDEEPPLRAGTAKPGDKL